MITPPTPTVSAVEGLRGLVEALETCARTYKDSYSWERCAHCHDTVKPVHELSHCDPAYCNGGIARAALARWRERAPLREDAGAIKIIRETLRQFEGDEESGPGVIARQILGALDSLLPSPPTRGAGT